MSACPVCDEPALEPFIRRERVPVHQNLLFATREAALAALRGSLDLQCCTRCGLLTNVAFQTELISYGEHYENTQTVSPCFDRYVEGLVEELVAEGIRGKRVVEVGCGKGYFLRRLCLRGGNEGFGFDPSYVGPEVDLGGRLRFIRSFYGVEQASLRADAVICRHVIEHVPRPLELLGRVREAVSASPAATVYFETPDLEWILDGVVLWDFFYEHCSYFTAASLSNAFIRAGFKPLAVRRLFGGQYLWMKASLASTASSFERPWPTLRQKLLGYAAAEERKVAVWQSTVEEMSARGVAVWGAGAKGITFVNLLDPQASRIRCLVDINPAKQHRYAAGTGHAIVPPEELRPREVSNVILMNPNYAEETQRIADSAGLEIQLRVGG